MNKYLLGGLTAVIAAMPSGAATYNPFDAFSVTGNQLAFPNFQVGDFAAGVLTPAVTIQENGYAADVDIAYGATIFGGAYKNTRGVGFSIGSVIFETDRLNIHAGAGDIALAFIAPSAGEYSFVGQFSSQDSAYGTKTVSALNGAEGVFSHSLVRNVDYDFSFARTLAAGDKVFFVLGGPGYASTSTGILLNVSPTAAVPEPASWALMIAGFALAGAASRRRRVNVRLT